MTALAVLDQVPIAQGGTPGDAIRHSVELAEHAEQLGYAAHWFAEHHLDPGRASSAPAVVIALALARTRTIRLGSAATVLPFHTSLEVAEEFGTLAAAAPGRVVLGLGRSAHGYAKVAPYPELTDAIRNLAATPGTQTGDAHVPPRGTDYVFDLVGHLSHAPLLVPDEESRLNEIVNLLERPVAVTDRAEYRLSPGYQADLGLAVFGGASGWSATQAAKRGLPLYVNAHAIKNDIASTVARYRADFQASKRLDAPYVGVSAHAVAAPTAAEGRRLEETYLRTLASLRHRGAYLPTVAPTGDFVEPHDERFQDSRGLSFAGDARGVVEQLRALATRVSADEVLVSTIVHSPEDRTRSYRLIAEAW